MSDEVGTRTYYDCEGGATIAEYIESGGSITPAWSKSYIYLGSELLSTLVPNGSGGENVQYHHSDGLGTRLVTDPSNGTSFEQVTLPFGTALNAESTGATNRRFTSYDRSGTTGLDYAVNRHYDPQQGRFTQVDPAGMSATSLGSPQTLNLYAYCANDPVNNLDPSGLGFFSFLKNAFSSIGKFIGKVLTNKWVLLIAGIALGVLSGFGFYLAFTANVVGTAVNTAFLWKAIALAAMSALLIVGAFHQGFLRVVRTISGIASTVQGIAGLLNGAINGGMWGTPPWNPNRGTGVGPVSQFACTDCVDIGGCGGSASNPCRIFGGTAIAFPGGRKTGSDTRDFLAGIIDNGVGPPPIFGWSLGRILRLGADRLAGHYANEDSWAYTIGSYVPDVVAVAAGGGAVRSLGFRAKFGLHDAHHTFGRFGPRSHLQVNIWQKVSRVRAM